MTERSFDAGYLDPDRPSPVMREAFTARPEYTDAEEAKVLLASATRRIIDEQVTTAADAAAILQAQRLVRQAADLLAGGAHGRPYSEPAEGSFERPQTRSFPSYSPFLGLLNPMAPPMSIEWGNDSVVGTASFGLAYEGPPGCLHGGFIAACFDEILGLSQGFSGQVGMTGRLTVHYRSPTPLFTALEFRGRLVRVEGRKVFTEATLHAGDTLCAEAEGLFISMKPEVFERLTAMRGVTRPPN